MSETSPRVRRNRRRLGAGLAVLALGAFTAETTPVGTGVAEVAHVAFAAGDGAAHGVEAQLQQSVLPQPPVFGPHEKTVTVVAEAGDGADTLIARAEGTDLSAEQMFTLQQDITAEIPRADHGVIHPGDQFTLPVYGTPKK
jgi:hypothetical protein